MLGWASRGVGRGRALPGEWPTWMALAGCYGAWITSLWAFGQIGLWAFVPLALTVGFHSSLQHEILHGHPTRSAALNEALIWLPLGFYMPYRRFRETHLRHHNDNRLTDPYDDPESFYVAEGDFSRLDPLMRAVLTANATFGGRILIGPALALYGFWRAELRRARAGDREVIVAWAHHFAGLLVVLPLIWWMGVPLWLYALLAAYPGYSLIMVRSFIEHRADEDPKRRSGIVESGPFFSLLFLNNNLHRVHHERPAVAWFRLPELYRTERARYLAENGGYLVHGYREVIQRWLMRPREPVVHPLSYRNGPEVPPGTQ